MNHQQSQGYHRNTLQGLYSSDLSESIQAHWRHRCRGFYDIVDESDYSNTQFRGFESSRNLTIRHTSHSNSGILLEFRFSSDNAPEPNPYWMYLKWTQNSFSSVTAMGGLFRIALSPSWPLGIAIITVSVKTWWLVALGTWLGCFWMANEPPINPLTLEII